MPLVDCEEETAGNQERIEDVAFAEKGCNAARLDEVVAAAGLSNRTLHWHCKSKTTCSPWSLEGCPPGRWATWTGARGVRGAVGALNRFTRALKRAGPLTSLMLELPTITLRKEWACARGRRARGARPVPVEDTAIALASLILVWVLSGRMDLRPHAEHALQLTLEGLRLQPMR